jgi:ABC-type glutathione transport system ATPase component/ABC-type dipeptide/oligopeptide/nickel transport system permease subunit
MSVAFGLRRIGLVLVASMLLLALAGPLVAPYAPDAWAGQPFEAPSASHWLGTDDMGQDLWSALLYGARHSVLIAFLVAFGATTLGTLLGAGAGYLGGRWDFAAMRLLDFQLTLPTLPLVLVAAFYAGPNLAVLVGMLILSLWAECARQLRPQAAALRHADYVVAELAMGAGKGDILLRTVIPAMTPLIWAQFTRLVHHAVLLESALAFLGLGDPQRVSWGSTLYYANARAAFLGDAWLWWVLPPGLAIALLVLGFALLGVGLPRGAALRAPIRPCTSVPSPAPDREHLLEVQELDVYYPGKTIPALQNCSLHLCSGEVLGLLGLSGAGKSTLVRTLLGLLPQGALIKQGAAWLAGEELLSMPEKIRRARSSEGIAWIPQAAMQSLNPVRSVGSQLYEAAYLADRRHKREARALVHEALSQVDLSPALLKAYPHQLSGGMRQRVVIAMVLCRRPQVLLADEPSSGVDSEHEHEILSLLVRLCRERHMALLLISHDLALLTRHCHRLAILERGSIVESATVARLLAAPQSSVARALVAAAERRYGCCGQVSAEAPAVLEFHAVDFAYAPAAGVQGLSLQVKSGECVGLIGCSGAGKSTVARLALGLLLPQRGTVRLLGSDLARLRGAELARQRRKAHLIFQDPYAALPHKRRVCDVVSEPLRLAGIDRHTRLQAAGVALSEAGLAWVEYLERDIDSLSGGERQRVALTRALIHQPRLIVADEPTSMLDMPAKWAWLERLNTLRRERGLAVLLITHDRVQALAFCDRIAVLEQGRLVDVFVPERLVPAGDIGRSPIPGTTSDKPRDA